MSPDRTEDDNPNPKLTSRCVNTQMDGLGGGYSSVSKVAILDDSPPQGDVNYLFGQVSVTADTIDWSGSCGNLCAAVAVWAIEEGLVAAPEEPGLTTVQVWNANHGKMVEARVPTSKGAPEAPKQKPETKKPNPQRPSGRLTVPSRSTGSATLGPRSCSIFLTRVGVRTRETPAPV